MGLSKGMNGTLTSILVFSFFLCSSMRADDGDFYALCSGEEKKSLDAGNAVLLDRRPDEMAEGSEVDSRFSSAARLITGTRAEIWEVIHDKDNAEEIFNGVLESRVLEESETELLVVQKTHVGGPKGAYRYTLRHKLKPMKRADFAFVEGEIKNVLGSWWIFDSPDPERKLVVYSLHIDPGIYAPQFLVRRGIRKTIPATLAAIQKEVDRRKQEAGNP